MLNSKRKAPAGTLRLFHCPSPSSLDCTMDGENNSTFEVAGEGNYSHWRCLYCSLSRYWCYCWEGCSTPFGARTWGSCAIAVGACMAWENVALAAEIQKNTLALAAWASSCWLETGEKASSGRWEPLRTLAQVEAAIQAHWRWADWDDGGLAQH